MKVMGFYRKIENITNTHLCLLGLATLTIHFLFLWQGNVGFSLSDEGFLWYGVQRVMLGEVPIRDFMAYDPGRYYWSAALAGIIGDNSIMTVRIAVAIFQVLGLFAGLILIAQSSSVKKRSCYIFWIISAVTLAAWMFPRHKLFDISLSIFLIAILTFLLKNPNSKRYFIAGICLGFVAVFGRNHGFYGAVGSLGVMIWLCAKTKWDTNVFIKRPVFWCFGVLVGFSPILFMALFVPGFAIAFWESVRFLFQSNATNLPLPVPWPWTVDFKAFGLFDAIPRVLIGFFFIGTLAFGVGGVLWVVIQTLRDRHVQPALVACAFLALPYSHYAFSRADVSHLSQGIFPLLIGCLVILSGVDIKIKWIGAVVLCVTSFWAMYVVHPGWQCMTNKNYVHVEISGDNLLIDPRTARDVAFLRQLDKQYTPTGQSFVVTPFWPGAYALFESKSPMWAIYALWARSGEFQEMEIQRMRAAKPGFVFIMDLPLDGHDYLRFRNTNPLIHQYITENFDAIAIPNTPHSSYQIYKPKSMVQ